MTLARAMTNITKFMYASGGRVRGEREDGLKFVRAVDNEVLARLSGGEQNVVLASPGVGRSHAR